jgi:hypothetical protein
MNAVQKKMHGGEHYDQTWSNANSSGSHMKLKGRSGTKRVVNGRKKEVLQQGSTEVDDTSWQVQNRDLRICLVL